MRREHESDHEIETIIAKTGGGLFEQRRFVFRTEAHVIKARRHLFEALAMPATWAAVRWASGEVPPMAL